MALNIYQQDRPGVYKKITKVSDTIEKNQIITTHDGKTGDSVELELHISADDIKVYYSSITLYPENLTSTNYINGTSTGWGIKLREGDNQPTQSEWENISYGNTISFSNIGSGTYGDTSTYLPFWVRIECPSYSVIRDKEVICLTISYIENLIEAEHWR